MEIAACDFPQSFHFLILINDCKLANPFRLYTTTWAPFSWQHSSPCCFTILRVHVCIAFLLFYHYRSVTAFLTYSCQSRTNSHNPDIVPPVDDKVPLKVFKQRRHLNHSKRKNSFPYILLTKPAGMAELRKEVQNNVHIENPGSRDKTVC